MKKIFGFIFLVCLTMACSENNSKESSIDSKIDSLLSVMTIEEKVGQLNLYNGQWDMTGPVPENDNARERADNIRNGRVTGMLNVLTVDGIMAAQKLAVEESRLGIPMIFGYDVVHGYKTMLPIPLAQAASWDTEVARKGNQLAAKEAASSGLTWAFAPMVDVSRDARWGRIMEGAGEDPYLSAVMAEAWVNGFQGEDLSDPLTLAACSKHFAGYGFVKAGIDYNTTELSMQTLHNVALPPFKAAVDAGVASVMNGFTDMNGVPVTASEYLQRDILKEKWGFEGFVVSDFNSVYELITHGYSKDKKNAALDAFTAGSDVEMDSRLYEKNLEKLLNENKIDETLLDEAVSRVLRIKYELGLFDDPYKYLNEDREKSNLMTDEALEIARDAARKSMVLLKNEANTLPLSEKIKSIAVIGQLANSKDVPLGSWRAQAVTNSAVSLLEGIQNAVSDARVKFAQGYRITEGDRSFIYELNMVKEDRSGFNEAINLARTSEVVVMALGEDCFQTGEGRSQADIGLKGSQEDLLKEILKVNKNVIVVLMNGRPLAIPYVVENVPVILEAWHLGSEAGNAIADVLFGKFNPQGKLPVSFPYHSGQEPLFYNKKNTGRPETNEFDKGLVFWKHYTDFPTNALIPFGHGLSYSSFEYSDLKVTPSKGKVDVSVTVENTSEIPGTETIQVYIRDIFASETQPIKRLVDFSKETLNENESVTASFTLTAEDLGFYLSDGKFVTEDGEFMVMVGGNSVDLLKEKVTVTF